LSDLDCTEQVAPATKWPARHGVFFGTSLWLGFSRGAVEANGEAVGATFFLTAFGFFFSRLLLFWPLATVSSYGSVSPASDRYRLLLDRKTDGFDADAIMWPVRDAS
jgi:hypothetical protein